MSPGDSDVDYWEGRARRYGARAAGYQDAGMDLYEDRLRRSAIRRLLGRGEGRRLLDAGCGSGRWSVRLAQAGWVVTGADFSPTLIGHAPTAPNVAYVVGSIRDLAFTDEAFDAFLSVTVLQHIRDHREYEASLDNLTRMLRCRGLAAVLEYGPLVRLGRAPANMRARSRSAWVADFTARGYRLRSETGIRFAGHGPYMIGLRLLRRLATRGGPEPALLRLLRRAGWTLDLVLARVPWLTLTGDVRLFVFEKGSSQGVP